MKFAPFNGAYPGHEDAMQAANLAPERNLWYAVYDFNDEEKSGRNWSFIKKEEEDGLWCPLGVAENCVPRTDAHGALVVKVDDCRGHHQEAVVEIEIKDEAIETEESVESNADNGGTTCTDSHGRSPSPSQIMMESREPAFALAIEFITSMYATMKSKTAMVLQHASNLWSNMANTIRTRIRMNRQ